MNLPALQLFGLLVFGAATTVVAATPPVNPGPGAADAVVSGDLIVEPPTLENLGFEWKIGGDADRDASVAVAYRKKGDATWIESLPLMRLSGESVVSVGFAPAFTYIAPNMFAGSVFNVQPDTEYEARFTLTDPDGVIGQVIKTVSVRTRAEPQPSAVGMVYHVYPDGWTGPKQQPAFTNLLGAYYQGAVGGDWYNAFPERVKPGDTILIHAGVYKQNWRFYATESYPGRADTSGPTCCYATGDGTYYLTAKGTADRPIAIKAAGDGEVVFDGDGNANLFNLMAADYHYFEGITFRNTRIAIEAGIKRIAGSKGLTVKRSKFIDVGVGIHTDFAGSRDYYIADNEFVGRHDPSTLFGWQVPQWGSDPRFKELGEMKSQYAVKVYGAGHVIAYNRIRNFHDGIDHATYGNPEGYPDTPQDRKPVSIDIIGNDISNMHDNCIEADGAMHNIRVMRNRCVNSAAQGFSMQPLMGGPAYFIRNVMYNSPLSGSIKFSETPAGGVFYHNTWFSNFAPGPASAGSNMNLRNNIIFPQNRAIPVLQMATLTSYSSSDYNGFGVGDLPSPFMWNVAAPKAAGGVPNMATTKSRSLADHQRASGQDRHSILVDYSMFEHVVAIDPKAPVTSIYDADKIDVRLRPGAAAIDKGVALPGINSGWSGSAPDLGAVESGEPAPHYGPRPQ